jgi:hypothetical protein
MRLISAVFITTLVAGIARAENHKTVDSADAAVLMYFTRGEQQLVVNTCLDGQRAIMLDDGLWCATKAPRP